MTYLYFVRHAQPDYSVKNTLERPLTAEGLNDRFATLDYFNDIDISAVFSSNYKRAYDTVKPIADKFGLEVITDTRLRERFSGEVPCESREFFRRQWNDFSYKTRNGECLKEVQERNIEAVKEILRDYKGKSVVIGTHGASLNAIKNYYDRRLCHDEFMRTIDFMPYIYEMEFAGEKFVKGEDIFYIEKEFIRPQHVK